MNVRSCETTPKEGGVSSFSVENYLSHSAENFPRGTPYCFNNFGYRKMLGINRKNFWQGSDSNPSCILHLRRKITRFDTSTLTSSKFLSRLLAFMKQFIDAKFPTQTCTYQLCCDCWVPYCGSEIEKKSVSQLRKFNLVKLQRSHS